MAGETGNARRFSEGTRVVVVGIGDYSGSGLPNLPACPNEAIEIALALASPNCCAVPKAQIRLIPESEATAKAILASVQKEAADAAPDEILIVYSLGTARTRETASS